MPTGTKNKKKPKHIPVMLRYIGGVEIGELNSVTLGALCPGVLGVVILNVKTTATMRKSLLADMKKRLPTEYEVLFTVPVYYSILFLGKVKKISKTTRKQKKLVYDVRILVELSNAGEDGIIKSEKQNKKEGE